MPKGRQGGQWVSQDTRPCSRADGPSAERRWRWWNTRSSLPDLHPGRLVDSV